MEWEVEFTDEFSKWWDGLTEAEQVDVNAKVILLQKIGPSLPRPHADLVHSSRHPNMKELRIQHSGRPYRVLFAFDPRRCAILLIGGDKTGEEAAKKMISEMGLAELREAMDLTQESLADTLHVKQASISKMERRSDMYISTLSKIIEAMGGELQIIAKMPNGRVQIRQFTKIRKGESESVQAKGRAGVRQIG